jgi:hypothetical protein
MLRQKAQSSWVLEVPNWTNNYFNSQ